MGRSAPDRDDEQRVQELDSTLRVLSSRRCSTLHATDRAALLAEVCRTIAEGVPNRAAWIGLLDSDRISLRPAVHANVVEGWLRFLPHTPDCTDPALNPIAYVLRRAKPCLCSDLIAEDRFPAWREMAVQHGYGSMLAVPVMKDDGALGVILAFSPQADAFGESERESLLHQAVALGDRLWMMESGAAMRAEAQRRIEQYPPLKLDSIPPSEAEIADLELADIVDVPKVQSLMEDFYGLSHIPVGIIDMNGRVLVGVGWQTICTDFHRVNPESYENCLQSDCELTHGIPAGEYKLYKCRNHMWDAATPIVVGGKHLGNFFLGQFFFDDEQLDRSLFREQAKRLGFNESEYMAALERVPRLSRETLATSMSYFMKLADMISTLGYSNARLTRLLSERDALARSLDESSRELRQVIDAAPDYIWSADVSASGAMTLRYGSPVLERITGRPAAYFVSSLPERWFGIIHSEDLTSVQAARQRLGTLQSSAEEQEYRIVLPDGRFRWVRDSICAIPTETGVRFHGVISDITERKRIEDQLRESQKMEAIGKLAGGIAHDFNNLMTIVSGYSELLLPALKEHPQLCGKLEEIHKAGEQATSLTRQLLAFSRRQVPQLTELNLGDVLMPMVSMLQRLLTENIELRVEMDPALGLIRCNRGQIEQVIMNLAINARDAMPQGGRLSIQTANITAAEDSACPAAGPDYVRLIVTDTGCGIDAQTMPHIFEPFFTTKEEGKGTGLGLATVFGIIKQAEGEITLTSEPGKGTSFRIYWPRVAGETARQATAELAEPARGSETILVVEDKDGLRTLVSEILQQNGYQVLSARDGHDALRLLEARREQVDLILTDLVMPKMGGRELAETVTASHAQCRILYMSGYADSPSEWGAPGQVFIEKPFTPIALLRKVRDILD